MARHFFDATAMIPPAWRAPTERVRVFNPAILCIAGQWLLVYRVVFTPSDHRLAICRLDSNLRVQPETVCALSDAIFDDGTLLQDPRLIEHQGRLWLYYDQSRSGQQNRLGFVELDLTTLQPKGTPRPLLLTGSRQRIEKNWLLFEHTDELYAVYRMAPHVILHLDLTPSDHVACRPLSSVTWDDRGYARCYGELRGGTPPVRVGDRYYSFFHSWYSSSRVDRLVRPLVVSGYHWLKQRSTAYPSLPATRQSSGVVVPTQAQPRSLVTWLFARYRRRFEQRYYVVGFYAFNAQPPFAPVCFTPTPILAPRRDDQRLFAHSLNPYTNRSVFPTGAVLQGIGQWVVSYGLDTEQAAFCTFDHQALLRSMISLTGRND